jgi:rod shape-determining protein MreB
MFWDRLERLLVHDVAIDLGTINTLIFLRGRGVVLAEPTLIATDRATGEVVAVGRDAMTLWGREPHGVMVHRPLHSGVIADYELTEKMLALFLQRALGSRPRLWTFLKVLVGTPSASTYIERRAVEDVLKRLGAVEVTLVEEGAAAAIGSGTLVRHDRACMIVDIGGGTTDISIVSPTGVVFSRSLTVAGVAMDRAIREALCSQHKVLIGEQTAEMIKRTIGAALPLPAPRVLTVAGKSLVTGSPCDVTIASEEVFLILDEVLRAILEGVCSVLEQVSPEIAADLCTTGITLTGGGSLLRDLDHRFRQKFTLPVHRAENPLESVVHGLGYLLQEQEMRNRFACTEAAAEWMNDMAYSAAR